MQEFVKDIVMRILYKQSPDIDLSEHEAALLDSLPPVESIPLLREIFDHEPDEAVKSRTFDAILAIRGFDRVQFLLDLLDQAWIDLQSAYDWRLVGWRLAYCRQLARFPDPRAIAKLCAILRHDPDPDMRYTAAESLAEVGDATAIAALEYAQAHDPGTDYEGFPIARMAGQALQQIRSRAHT